MKTTTFNFDNYTASVVNVYECPSIDFCRSFFSHFKALADFFSEDKVYEVIKNKQIKIRDFMTVKYYDYSSTLNLVERGYYLADDKIHTYKRTEYKGTWSREVNERGCAVLVKSQYGHHLAGIVLKDLLLSEFPYLKKFENELRVYEPALNSGIDEDWIFLYVDTNKSTQKNTPVYIKCKRLKERNFMGIMQDHIEYHTNYYKWPSGWGQGVTEQDVLKWREEACEVLTYPKAQEFFEAVEKDRLTHSDTSWMDNI